MDRGAWRAIVRGIAESDTTEQLTLSLLMEILNKKSDHLPTHFSTLPITFIYRYSHPSVSAGDQFQDPHGSHSLRMLKSLV